jgi:hypothetical protein
LSQIVVSVAIKNPAVDRSPVDTLAEVGVFRPLALNMIPYDAVARREIWNISPPEK